MGRPGNDIYPCAAWWLILGHLQGQARYAILALNTILKYVVRIIA